MTKVNHPCRKHTSGPFEWCMHEACRPEGRISEELKRMYGDADSKTESTETLDRVQDSAQFLVDAAQRMGDLQAELVGVGVQEKKLAVRREEIREQLGTLREKSAAVITSLAEQFKENHG